MKTFSLALVAEKCNEPKAYEVVFTASHTQALSLKEAQAKGITLARALWPAAYGYREHKAGACEIAKENT